MNWKPRNGVGIRVMSIMLFFFFMVTNGSKEKIEDGYETKINCCHKIIDIKTCYEPEPQCDGITWEYFAEKIKNAKSKEFVDNYAARLTKQFNAKTKEHRRSQYWRLFAVALCIMNIIIFSVLLSFQGLNGSDKMPKVLAIWILIATIGLLMGSIYWSYHGIEFRTRANMCQQLTNAISFEKSNALKKLDEEAKKLVEILNVKDIYNEEETEEEIKDKDIVKKADEPNTPPNPTLPIAAMENTYSETKEAAVQENESKISEAPASEESEPQPPQPVISENQNVPKPKKVPEEKDESIIKTDSKNYTIDIGCMVIGIIFVFVLYAYINMEVEPNTEGQIV